MRLFYIIVGVTYVTAVVLVGIFISLTDCLFAATFLGIPLMTEYAWNSNNKSPIYKAKKERTFLRRK